MLEALNETEALLTTEEDFLSNLDIKDDHWVENANIILEMFVDRGRFVSKKLTKFIEKIPTKRKKKGV